jgi:MFS family permease
VRTGTSLWRHRNFVLLWSGQSVSEVGSAVTVLALPLTAVVVLRASTFQVGLLTSASTLAFALIALPAGALVDRWAKRRLMIWCDVARLVIIGSVPLAAILGVLTLGQLYAVAVTAGVATVFFDVAYQSYLPVVVDRDRLVEGNGKLGATQAFAQVAGPGLGGALAGLIGAARALAVDAISYAISVASLLALDDREDIPPEGGQGGLGGKVPPQEQGGSRGDRPPRSTLRADIAEGLSFVLRHPVLRKIVACTGTANLFGSAGTALEIVFLIRVLRIRPADTGLLIAVASLGGVAGGLLAGRLGRWIGSARIIWYSMLVLSFPELLIPLAAPGWRVAAFPVGMAFFAFGGVVYNVAQVSYRQSICPPRLLGRMNAAVRWVVWGTIPLGGVIGGVLGTLAGVRVTLWIAYSGSWAAGWWVFFSPLRRQRDLETQRDPGERPDPEGQRDLPEQPDLEDRRAPGSGIPGQGGRERPDGTGPQLGD